MFSFKSIVLISLFIFSIILNTISFIHRKATQKSYTHKVQKPGMFVTFFKRVMIGVTIICALFAALGSIMNDLEMAIVFAVIMVICSLITTAIQRKYDITYQETDEYFVLTIKGYEYKVYYNDIAHWQWGPGEISVQEESWSEHDFVTISCRLFKPEILITKIAEMTFSGKFLRIDGIYPDDSVYPDDSMREKELIRMTKHDGYYYLIEDLVKENV